MFVGDTVAASYYSPADHSTTAGSVPLSSRHRLSTAISAAEGFDARGYRIWSKPTAYDCTLPWIVRLPGRTTMAMPPCHMQLQLLFTSKGRVPHLNDSKCDREAWSVNCELTPLSIKFSLPISIALHHSLQGVLQFS
jgi:hypothetical protein